MPSAQNEEEAETVGRNNLQEKPNEKGEKISSRNEKKNENTRRFSHFPQLTVKKFVYYVQNERTLKFICMRMQRNEPNG